MVGQDVHHVDLRIAGLFLEAAVDGAEVPAMGQDNVAFLQAYGLGTALDGLQRRAHAADAGSHHNHVRFDGFHDVGNGLGLVFPARGSRLRCGLLRSLGIVRGALFRRRILRRAASHGSQRRGPGHCCPCEELPAIHFHVDLLSKHPPLLGTESGGHAFEAPKRSPPRAFAKDAAKEVPPLRIRWMKMVA